MSNFAYTEVPNYGYSSGNSRQQAPSRPPPASSRSYPSQYEPSHHGGGGRRGGPAYDDYDDDDDMPGMFGRMNFGGQSMDPRGGQGNFQSSHSSYQDSNGNRHEQGYGPQGAYSSSRPGGSRSGGSRPGGSRHGGHRSTSHHDPRMGGGHGLGISGMGDPRATGFRSSDPPNPSQGPPAFNVEFYPDDDERPVRRAHGDSRAAQFMEQHTEFISQRNASNRTNDACPICLEGITEHVCVRIKGIPGCKHIIGLECLQAFLENNPEAKKECPMCRKEWLPEDPALGMWEDDPRMAAMRGMGGPRQAQMGGMGGMGDPRQAQMGGMGGAPGGAPRHVRDHGARGHPSSRGAPYGYDEYGGDPRGSGRPLGGHDGGYGGRMGEESGGSSRGGSRMARINAMFDGSAPFSLRPPPGYGRRG
jgi:hypothetical protein